jgi:acylphosphatase
MSGAEAAFRVRVTGRVQGVGYRAWVRDEADRRGLRGWVRNEPDGSVSALIAGPEAALAATLEALRKGPPLARVTRVATEPADPGGVPAGFRISRG